MLAQAVFAGVLGAQEAAKPDTKRPELTLKANPTISFAPTTVFLTAELKGGPNDSEELYCASVEWDWDDETKSESSFDCEPYEPGKSEIRRRFTTEHRYEMAGNYRVRIRLKKGTKVVLSAQTTVQVRPGATTYER
jgi:hypothetical protein